MKANESKICEPKVTTDSNSSDFDKENKFEANFTRGLWNKTEQYQFKRSLLENGKNWKILSQIIQTRTPDQCKSHLRKYFAGVKKKYIKDSWRDLDVKSNYDPNFDPNNNQSYANKWVNEFLVKEFEEIIIDDQTVKIQFIKNLGKILFKSVQGNKNKENINSKNQKKPHCCCNRGNQVCNCETIFCKDKDISDHESDCVKNENGFKFAYQDFENCNETVPEIDKNLNNNLNNNIIDPDINNNSKIFKIEKVPQNKSTQVATTTNIKFDNTDYITHTYPTVNMDNETFMNFDLNFLPNDYYDDKVNGCNNYFHNITKNIDSSKCSECPDFTQPIHGLLCFCVECGNNEM